MADCRGAGALQCHPGLVQLVSAADDRLLEYTREYAQVNGGDTQLASLIGAADADRKTYEQYLARSNEVHSNIGHAQLDASFVSNAAVPLKPYYPNTKMMVMIGLAIGGGGGIVLVGMMDSLLGGLRSKHEVEEALGIKCIGSVPRLRRLRRTRLPAVVLHSAIRTSWLRRPRETAFAQAIRSIQLKLVSFDSRVGCQAILVTGALPGEGKTWVATSLAVSLATDGFAVVLVDCDLHRPAVHRIFNRRRGPGLTDYLEGFATFDEIVHVDGVSGLNYIPVGSARSGKACGMSLLQN